MSITTPDPCDVCGTIHVAGEHEECRVRRLIMDKDAEIAALRERCGRLANEVMAWRMADADSSSPDFYTHKAHRREITERMAAVDAHNDLAHAAGEAQEKTDG